MQSASRRIGPASRCKAALSVLLVRVSWLNLEILLHKKNSVVQGEKVERPSDSINHVIYVMP
jgi:hypothetical protein